MEDASAFSPLSVFIAYLPRYFGFCDYQPMCREVGGCGKCKRDLRSCNSGARFANTVRRKGEGFAR